MQVVVTDGSVHVTTGFDDCPVVVVSAAPESARIGERVAIAAQATDDDPKDTLSYAWTAPAGAFASASAASTTYTCPALEHAGLQTLTVSVSDGNCTVKGSVTIACGAFADGGNPAGGSSGAAGGAGGATSGDGGIAGAGGGTAGGGGAGTGGAGGSCVGDPTRCEGTLCNQCTFGVDDGDTDLCSATTENCFNCDPATMGCGFYTSDADLTHCQALYACVRDHGCASKDGDPMPCWCGTAAFDVCKAGTVPANGPCLQQVIDAAKTSDPASINARWIDPLYPLGGAMNLAICRATFCGKAADAVQPSCPLW